MEVAGEGGRRRLYTYRYIVTTRIRWAAILMFHHCEGQSHKTVPQTTTFEDKGEPKWVRTEVLLLTSLVPYHYAKPAHMFTAVKTLFQEHPKDPTRVTVLI